MTKLLFCKLLKKNSGGCPSHQVSASATRPPCRTKNGEPFNCFLSRVGLMTYQHPCTQHTVGHLVISCCFTKPQQHHEDGDRVSPSNTTELLHLDAAVCPRTAQNIVKEIKQYQKKWLQHVQRMDTNGIPKQALQYKPKGRRNVGRPRRDGGTKFILRIKEQETCLTLQEHDDDDDDGYLVCAQGTSSLNDTHLLCRCCILRRIGS